MTPAGALAITGAVLLMCSAFLGAIAVDLPEGNTCARVGWPLFLLSVACLAVSPWLEVAS